MIRIVIAAIWLLAPPILLVHALRLWRLGLPPVGWKGRLPVTVAVAVLVNWLLFITFVFAGQIGGFGSHYMTMRLADVFLLVSLLILIASSFTHTGRWALSLASFLMLALWVGSEMVA